MKLLNGKTIDFEYEILDRFECTDGRYQYLILNYEDSKTYITEISEVLYECD